MTTAEPSQSKDGKVSIKLPQMSKRDMNAFLHSTFDQVGLKGPPHGVQQMEWSFDAQYLATKCESMPAVVWVWDMTTLELATVLIHLQPVKSFKFSPHAH